MATTKKRINFADSIEGLEVMYILSVMQKDNSYNTPDSYSANTTLYPNNVMSFVEKHMQYLSVHPTTNPGQYVSNLRLMTQIKLH